MKGEKIAVGMSGGVDSSVTALILKDLGYDVFGLYMKNWEEGDCHGKDDYDDVRRVCDQIDIPYYGVNFVKEYQDRVFATFIEEFKKGFTPNPDVLCNREIKFDCLLKKALSLGATKLATGHYCRTDGKHLLRGLDPNKDQSYFLHMVSSSALEKTLFPLGDLEKPKVRALAAKHNLATAKKKDSTGICFIGKRNFRPFLKQYLTPKPGPFIDPNGKILGTHEGAVFYTIGQRKGLGIGGPGPAYYVAAKNTQENTVTLVQGEDHPLLLKTHLSATDANWITTPPPFPLTCTAKIRYRTRDVPCTVTSQGSTLQIAFDTPVWAPTPRQSIVFYDKDICLGGALLSDLTQ